MKNLFAVLLLLTGLSQVALAGVPVGSTPGDAPAASISTCQYGTARAELDINNVRCLLLNGGDMWWDLIRNPKYEIPKATDPNTVPKHSMYAASIWVAGRIQGTTNIVVMAQTYRNSSRDFSYWPGPIDTITTSTSPQRCLSWDKMFKINRSDVNDFVQKRAAGLINSFDDVPVSVRTWPGRRNPYLPTDREYAGINTDFSLADFNDANSDGIYNPLDGDTPKLPGAEQGSTGADQCIFWVMNDVGNRKLFSGVPGGTSIGMEVHTEAFGYSTADFVNDMTFYRQKLINKGTQILSDCYFAQWCDPDLGYANDDYVGFDVPRGLAICYNGDDNDEGVQGYGPNPPAVAVDFFIGPAADPNDGVDNDKDSIVDEPGEKIIASNFVYYNNDANNVNGNPDNAQQYFYYTRSIWKNGQEMTYDMSNGTTPEGTCVTLGNGQQYQVQTNRYMFPGCSDQNIGWGVGGTPTNPVAMPDWWEWNAVTYNESGTCRTIKNNQGNTAGDRRFLTSAGPFTLKPGATNNLTIGVVWVRPHNGRSCAPTSKLLVADDESQKLFDNNFKILSGPPAPDVEVVELDQELVFSLRPANVARADGSIVNTESYEETDFNARLRDNKYRFQGYLVYQLANSTVGLNNLDDPSQARLLADVSSDVKDGVTSIINTEYDAEVNEYVPKLKVRGSDQGIRYTFRITSDVFATGNSSRLVNFKKYYFKVVAYGYNGDPNQRIKFILGRENVDKEVSGTPHKSTVEFQGQQILSSFGQTFNITRLAGLGNGGTTLQSLDSLQEVDVVQNNSRQTVRYSDQGAPINVTIYNTKLVQKDSFNIKLYGRVSYFGGPDAFKPGDIIRSRWSTFDPNQIINIGGNNFFTRPYENILQDTGRAQVVSVRNRTVNGRNMVDLEVVVLNDDKGGRFTRIFTRFGTTTDEDFLEYVTVPQDFYKESDPSVTATCVDFAPYDFWRLFSESKGFDSPDKAVDLSQRLISQAPEQLSPNFGLSIKVQNTISPAQYPHTNPRNGLQTSSVTFSDNSWFNGVPYVADNTKYDWFNKGPGWNPETKKSYTAFDINDQFKNILGGSWTAYSAAKPFNTNADNAGATYVYAGNKNEELNLARANLRSLANVDIVFTPDKSKWSRVLVIQADSTTAKYNFAKSRLSSVDKNFAPSGETSPFTGAGTIASRGMSWFPGYAIDLDRGIRLNMMFMESRKSDQAKGNNLRWEPLPDSGGKSYVYIMTDIYDGGQRWERLHDSIDITLNAAPQALRRQTAFRAMFARTMWVGNLALSSTEVDPYTQSMARVSLRIDRSYQAYPGITSDGLPTFGFSTDGLQTSRNFLANAKSGLDLIRVVPNPYYAYSSYETSQVDNRVKITNIPTRCKITILTLSGSIIRQFRVDNSGQTGINAQTWQDWDLKNQTGLPIASGVYLIHVQGDKNVGEKVVKFFCVMRPTDLDALSTN